MGLYYDIKTRVPRMPTGLGAITFLCAFLSIFAPLSLVPGGDYAIDGVAINFAEFWRRGGGPIFFGLGVFCALLAYGFVRVRGWSRLLLMLAITALTVIDVYEGAERRGQAVSTAIAVTGLMFWYLFRRQSVREYFSRSPNRAA